MHVHPRSTWRRRGRTKQVPSTTKWRPFWRYPTYVTLRYARTHADSPNDTRRNGLQRMGKHMEAATYFQAAAGLQLKYSPMGGLTSYQHAARCFLFQRTYITCFRFFSLFCVF